MTGKLGNWSTRKPGSDAPENIRTPSTNPSNNNIKSPIRYSILLNLLQPNINLQIINKQHQQQPHIMNNIHNGNVKIQQENIYKNNLDDVINNFNIQHQTIIANYNGSPTQFKFTTTGMMENIMRQLELAVLIYRESQNMTNGSTGK